MINFIVVVIVVVAIVVFGCLARGWLGSAMASHRFRSPRHPFPPGPWLFPSRSEPLSCPVCHMYSYNPDSFAEMGVCNKCSVFAVLEARLCELEAGLANGAFSLPSAHVRPGSGGRYRPRSPIAAACAPHKQRRDQNGWVAAAGGKHTSKQKHTGHQPLHVSNRFSPLTAAPIESDSESPALINDTVSLPAKPVIKNTTLVIGSSIMRNVKLVTPGTIVKCIPGARAGDIESNLKMMAKSKCNRYNKIIIHCGGNDTRLKRSEITKINVESVCTYAMTMSDSVIFSGPLPNMIDDEMYSRMSSFNRWLSRWCPDNNVGFINHWQTFEGKTGLMGRDGIHPTWDGAGLISKNMDLIINKS